MKGNVFDMAIGIIIGGAFSKIVSSLVNDLIMPVFGFLVGTKDLSLLAFQVQRLGTTGEENLIAIKYGSFLAVILDFLIIAFSIFLVIKFITRLRKKMEAKAAAQAKAAEAAEPAPPPAPTQEQLLAEIRDLLKAQHETSK